MKNLLFLSAAFLVIPAANAQKIIPITHNGVHYEVLDLSAKGRIPWGGYTAIPGDAARSESDGSANSSAIIATVGNNDDHKGKIYAARLCSEAKDGGKDDWYLPARNETDIIYASREKFDVEEKGSIWSSTEVNGTQAYTKYWYNGSFYKSQKVQEYYTLCIRKAD